ncbi:MAG: hypothetical protein QW510_00170 [Candidatus Bathyarchaeia archaeon]
MAGSTIDHLIAMTVFLGAILIFVGLFNQTIQTAILYQRNRYLATKCSDLLDNILLNPGIPENWGRSNVTPTSFGLQDPEFTQYRLSPFSLMRLVSSVGRPIYYPRTGRYYSNITVGWGSFLFVSYAECVNYTTVSKLLGVNGSFGFQLTIEPIVNVYISKVSVGKPLKLMVKVVGSGFPLVNSPLSYLFFFVQKSNKQYPQYSVESGVASTNNEGNVLLTFSNVDGEGDSYALIAYAHFCGLVGIGYFSHVTTSLDEYIVPMVDSFEERRVLLAHSWAVKEPRDKTSQSELKYNASFVILSEDFTLREVPLENSTGKVGHVVYGQGSEKAYGIITIPTYNPGVLIVTYRKSAIEYGVVLMPWGISSLAFPVVFGENPIGKTWVATDIRQVIVNGVAYQAKLALWSLEGYQVIG